MRQFLLSVGLLLIVASVCRGQETQRFYLSGKGKDDGVPWDFMCSAGMKANTWSTIKVPSNWELQGFGIYTYGRDNLRPWPRVEGRYKRTFQVPADWAGKRVFLCFDGSMTDTQASVNGKSAGPIHQGGYYPFRYDITDLVRRDADNLLEVTVQDESANASVNNAERRGDYWNYAGIFRPVYVEAVPAEHIDRVAIDARADGTLIADIFYSVAASPAAGYEMSVLDSAGKVVARRGLDVLNGVSGRVTMKVENPALWTAETPNLYTLEVKISRGTNNLHTVHQKFGFRTIEVRRGDTPNPGLFVNGRRIMLKGADRHSFWPDSGRCLSEQISRDDIQVMKEMNMNAVRMSHYPPDAHFLDLCDEMGMYVLDELAGWHQKYDAPTGHRLIEEMVTRDINHPSILFWDNGNEGGWNTELDDDFARWDPQQRRVLHPWESFRGIDTKHYPVYSLLQQKAAGNDLFFPTEMLHGLYDGGAGAGLQDYWDVLRTSKVAAGGFIWALVDESLKRTDQDGRLDSKGNQAPDGILGPYREKEGSFYAIKQLWSPIVVTKKGDEFIVENRYSFIDAKDCTYTLESRRLPELNGSGTESTVVFSDTATTDGSIPPGTTGKLKMPAPHTISRYRVDVMALIVKDPTGRELWTYTWPADNTAITDSVLESGPKEQPHSDQNDTDLSVTVGQFAVHISKQTGQITSLSRASKAFSLKNGPRFVEGLPIPEPPARGNRGAPPASAPAPVPPAPASALTALTTKQDGTDLLITATYTGALKNITYRIRPNGWITMDYAYALTGPRDYFGIAFDYPEANVRSMRYLGEGPYRVWKNRLAGTTLGVWDKRYNDTSTGEPGADQSGAFDYPEFKGIYAGVRWLTLQTSEGPIQVIVDQHDPVRGERAAEAQPLFVQVLKPRLPRAGDALKSGVNVSDSGLAFLHALPPIGNKFDYPSVLGPQSQRTTASGEYRGMISIYCGPLVR